VSIDKFLLNLQRKQDFNDVILLSHANSEHK